MPHGRAVVNRGSRRKADLRRLNLQSIRKLVPGLFGVGEGIAFAYPRGGFRIGS